MKKIKLAEKIFLINWMYFFIYNTYFGWNMHSLSVNETNCDNIFKYVMCFALWIYFLPLVDAYRKFIRTYLD